MRLLNTLPKPHQEAAVGVPEPEDFAKMRVRPKRTQTQATNVLSELGDRLLMISPDALQPYPRNARTHSKKQIGQIAASIRRFGFTNPVLIDDGNMILAGHARVEAARQLGLKSVPCLRLSTLSPAEKRAYILIVNKQRPERRLGRRTPRRRARIPSNASRRDRDRPHRLLNRGSGSAARSGRHRSIGRER